MASSARIDELRKKFEENPRRYFAPLANEYRKAGQIDQAIAICREYLPQQPGHMSGHIVYGQALYEARQFEEAKGVFETALSLDPENLIALRHLGDIALLIGDSDAARTWYRRVLEADPRNEEIQAQLLTLEQASPTPASAGSPEASSTARTVVLEAQQPPSAESSQPSRPSGESRRFQPWAKKTPSTPMLAASDQTPAAGIAQVTPTSKTLESMPAIDTPMRVDTATPVSQPASGLELDVPVAGTGSPKATTIPIETSSVAGLETTSLSGGAPAAESLLSAPGAGPPGATRDAGLPRLSLLDVPTVHAEPSNVPPESGPFVTETMAELYLQQGHREEALRVYRALLDQRPGDAGFQERVAKLEAEIAAATPSASTSAPSAPPTTRSEPRSEAREIPPASSTDAGALGPSMRELLLAIAQRRPGFRPERVGGNGGAPATSRETAPPAPTPSVTRDALAQLFSNAAISSDDEGAALVLALAFTELHNGSPLPGASLTEGAPAHRASKELSLETVFGSGHAAAGASVSYDQFFAQRPSGGQSPGAVDPKDDVAHFTKWLEGLKRR
jgi:tetratricopeptide (TPR) repeat protein